MPWCASDINKKTWFLVSQGCAPLFLSIEMSHCDPSVLELHPLAVRGKNDSRYPQQLLQEIELHRWSGKSAQYRPMPAATCIHYRRTSCLYVPIGKNVRTQTSTTSDCQYGKCRLDHVHRDVRPTTVWRPVFDLVMEGNRCTSWISKGKLGKPWKYRESTLVSHRLMPVATCIHYPRTKLCVCS